MPITGTHPLSRIPLLCGAAPLRSLDDVPVYARPFMKKFFGVDNPIHDVDMSDKAGIKKLVSSGAQEFAKLKKAIIAEHEPGGALLAGLAERMPALERTHPLATQIALLAFDQVKWIELSDALIEVIERERTESGRRSRQQ